ncbi:hypothetical protein INR49_028386 [Caranx melampygus]|nr:hypothetical protein INR49_028386 [Caranx melampygus]
MNVVMVPTGSMLLVSFNNVLRDREARGGGEGAEMEDERIYIELPNYIFRLYYENRFCVCTHTVPMQL